MARKPRIHYEGALYHVITRGNNRQKIFNREEDYKIFLNYLKTIKEKKGFNLYAYCLMPNHIHLLIEVKSHNLSVIMQRLLTSFTKYFNLNNKTWGHLFQGRYKAILCEKDSYLLELVRYIHLNPVRAKIAEKPKDWNWSGHKKYLGMSQDVFVDEEEVLQYFSDSKSKARVLYEEFVRDGIKAGHRKDLYPKESIPYLGNDHYIQKHIELHDDLIAKQTPGVVTDKAEMQAILKQVSKEFGISSEVITGSGRQSEAANVRKKFIIEAYKAGHRSADIARVLNRSISFISRHINREQ